MSVGLGAGGLVATAHASPAPLASVGASSPTTPVTPAVNRIRADAEGTVQLTRGDDGVVDFVGTPAGAGIDNPGVTTGMSIGAAADADVSRYGAALGTARAGTTLVRRATQPSLAGSVVHYTQEVAGLPVIGGDVVVTLGSDKSLTSMLSTMSDATTTSSARVTEGRAEQVAAQVAAPRGTSPDSMHVASQGRWLLDPAVLDTPATGVHSVWRIDVTGADHLDRELLIDDQTGNVLLDTDQNESVNRVVCDDGNVAQSTDVACTGGYARTETGASSSVTDVNTAFDLSKMVSDFYQAIGGIDLTALIGRDIGGGTKALASTVNWCYSGTSCPYENAFWNGSQMYYGQGYAGADDVVGHEMTHGVTDRYSQLFYWGQSGAINESQSDIMGEIMDHRHPSTGDSVTNWNIGEDLPAYSPDGIRNLATPDAPAYRDPDRMLSPDYNGPTSGYYSSSYYSDSGGVHDNSGVGNHTAYLIMKGGTFNGQTITGIDASDDTYTKTAMLYLLVDQTLASGSNYADLALVLDQSCNALVGGASGMTSTDCVNVHKAGLATELAQTPTAEPRVADATDACPTSAPVKTVLFDSESGTPASKFTDTSTTDSAWSRTESPIWGSNASSGQDSWNNTTDIVSASMSPGTSSMIASTPMVVPSGQQTYLRFKGWYLFDSALPNAPYHDGGTVQIDDTGDAAGPVSATDLPWVNGPDKTIASGSSSPIAGQRAFSGDSYGWVASRVDLSSYAGRSIEPQFTVGYDNARSYIGWFVDEVTIYSCAAAPPPPQPTSAPAATPSVAAGTVSISGKAVIHKRLTAAIAGFTPGGATLTYQWLRNGRAVAGATSSTYKLGKKDVGTRLSVQVTGSLSGYTPASTTSASTSKVRAARHRHRHHH